MVKGEALKLFFWDQILAPPLDGCVTFKLFKPLCASVSSVMREDKWALVHSAVVRIK